MTAILKVDTIQDTAGNNIINENADTITIGASGDTTNIVGTLQNNGSGLVSGITEADQWRQTADTSLSTSTNFTSNWERNDTVFDKIGTGMSESSGVFSFPSTGIWYVSFNAMATGGASDYIGAKIKVTTNNSSYTTRAESYQNTVAAQDWVGISTDVMVDVSDISNVKVHFYSDTGAALSIKGSTNANYTWSNFIRLGDT